MFRLLCLHWYKFLSHLFLGSRNQDLTFPKHYATIKPQKDNYRFNSSWCVSRFAVFVKNKLTTGLTIYRIFLCGNRRTHWSKMRKFAEYTCYFRADLFILHLRMSLGARCRRFKSCHSDHKGTLVAQRSSVFFLFGQISFFDVCYANQILFCLWQMLHSDHFFGSLCTKKTVIFARFRLFFCLFCTSDQFAQNRIFFIENNAWEQDTWFVCISSRTSLFTPVKIFYGVTVLVTPAFMPFFLIPLLSLEDVCILVIVL